jgi:hypothetical protein
MLGHIRSHPQEALAMTTLSAGATRRTRRFAEQRWLLDAVIQTAGLEWDQGRIGYSMAPCGVLAAPDFERVRSRVQEVR